MGIEPGLSGPQLLVVAAERRAAIARDEPRRIEPGSLVEPAAVKRQADERVNSRHVGQPLDKIEFVVQRDIAMVHGRPNPPKGFIPLICQIMKKLLAFFALLGL